LGDKNAYNIIQKIRANSTQLAKVCNQIGTGHIVNFRVKEKIFEQPRSGAYPLIDIKNIYKYHIDARPERMCPLWYKPTQGYDQRIRASNGIILVKRVTSPEQKRRIVTAYKNFETNPAYLGNKSNFINLERSGQGPFY